MEILTITLDRDLKKLLKDAAKNDHRAMSKQAVYYIEKGIIAGRNAKDTQKKDDQSLA